MKILSFLLIFFVFACVPKTKEGLIGEFDDENEQNQENEPEETIENILPQVSVGADRSITLPTKALNIQATASDSDGSIISYQWEKVSGGAATLVGSESSLLQLSN